MASRDELYAKFGITAEAAQLFETEIVTLLLGLRGKREQWHLKTKPDQASLFLAKIDKSTLGGLLKQLDKVTDSKGPMKIDDDLKNIFHSALETRNRLFHGFYLKHDFKIQTDIGRDEMIADLEVMHTELFNAWKLASKISEIFYKFLEVEISSSTTDREP